MALTHFQCICLLQQLPAEEAFNNVKEVKTGLKLDFAWNAVDFIIPIGIKQKQGLNGVSIKWFSVSWNLICLLFFRILILNPYDALD